MRKIFPLIILVTLLTGTIFFSPTCFAVETQTSQEVSIHEPTHDRVWVSSIPKGWYEKKEYVPLTAHHDHIHNWGVPCFIY